MNKFAWYVVLSCVPQIGIPFDLIECYATKTLSVVTLCGALSGLYRMLFRDTFACDILSWTASFVSIFIGLLP